MAFKTKFPRVLIFGLIICAALAAIAVIAIRDDSHTDVDISSMRRNENQVPENRASTQVLTKPKTETAHNAVNGNTPEEAWAKRCNEENTTCEVFQRIIVRETNQLIIEMAIKPKDDGSAQAGVVLPLGIIVANGILLQIDEQSPQNVKIRSCNQKGCFAIMDISDAFLQSLKDGNILNVKFLNGVERPVIAKLSLSGLTKQLNAL